MVYIWCFSLCTTAQVYELDTGFRNNLGNSNGFKIIQLVDNDLLIGNGMIRKVSPEGVQIQSFLWDPSAGLNGVRSMKEFADGKILVADKECVAPPSCWGSKVLRLHENGLMDNAFADSIIFHNPVVDMAILPDSSFIVAVGKVSNGGNVSAPSEGILKYDYSGILDTTFHFTKPDVYDPNVIRLQPDGRIIVGGRLGTQLNDSTYHFFGITRLNTNGSIDSSFSAPVVGSVLDIEILSDNRLLIGGAFSVEGYSDISDLTILGEDGTIDTTFVSEVEFNKVYQVECDSAETIWVGCLNYVGSASRSLVRLAPDGSIDESFDIGDGFRDAYDHYALDSWVEDLILQTDGAFIATGKFGTVLGQASRSYARLTVAGYVGIDEAENDFPLLIYPNPATTNLTIESRTPLAQVWVRDLAGRPSIHHPLVADGTQDDRVVIDLIGLPSGIYLVEVLTQNGQRSVQKVVVE